MNLNEARKVVSEASISVQDVGGKLSITGPYELMQKVYPKLKTKGFMFDGQTKAWWIETSRLTPKKRANIDALLLPFLGQNVRTRADVEKMIRELVAQGLAVNIPYEWKDKAKALGGLWDVNNKRWVMPDEESKKKILAMIPKPIPVPSRSTATTFVAPPRDNRRSIVRYSTNKTDRPAFDDVFRDKKLGDVVTVTHVQSDYISDDGLSLGAPFDSGWQHTIYIAPARAEQIVKFEVEELARKGRVDARTLLKEIIKNIQKDGVRPPGSNTLHGKEVLILNVGQRLYGGGSWFVIEPDHIWYVENNGSDGADWSRNNVRTGGAGAIGWRVPRTPELEAQLLVIAGKLGATPDF